MSARNSLRWPNIRRSIPRLLGRNASDPSAAEALQYPRGTIENVPAVLHMLEQFELLNPAIDELTAIADKFGSDKGLRHEYPHYYTFHYRRLFEPLRWQPLVLLEIGLLNKSRQDAVYGVRPNSESYSPTHPQKHRDAPSLRMWREYFPNARIIGLDIHDFSAIGIDNCETFICDQSDPVALTAVLEKIGASPTIIIDDGSHASEHQQVAFFTLFPALAPNGIYIIEDLQWQPPGIGNPTFPTTLSCLENFPDQLPWSPLYHAGIERRIRSVEIHDSLRFKRNIAVLFKIDPDLTPGSIR